MKRIILKSGEEGRIQRGHPWVYDNEVACMLAGKGASAGASPEPLLPGECADVESAQREYLGRAIVNPNSKIIARIYSPSKEGIDKGFFKRRIREALHRRAGFRDLSRESVRVVFAEADFLPGLIIDRFVGWPLAELEAAAERPLSFDLARSVLGPPRSWLSVQFLAWGMDCRRDMIIDAAGEVLGDPVNSAPNLLKDPVSERCSGDEAQAASPKLPEGVIEKSIARARELEGLLPREGTIRGNFPARGIVIFENGFPFALDLPEGQKTGHFLDQRDNRLLTAGFAAMLRDDPAPDEAGGNRPLRVLDACSYTGGFGIHALRAAENAALTAVDTSAAALDGLRKNAALNGLADQITAIEADVFESLRAFERKKEKFDLVILDPPAFAKSRTVLGEALRGYKEINLRALRLLRRNGILISCSCSHALDEAAFKRMIIEAAADAGRRLIQLDFRLQAPDHPVLIGYDESLYLKCGFYRVL
ncbi:MAG: class I SAM-dependent rRNA methyltransferase [Treponema sp.]|jgi:23S rRNA (cytosine1962-C5)-methyltransferase|nr:class I SAM-dependent rRNA methyltransferase [Treponema sp.]